MKKPPLLPHVIHRKDTRGFALLITITLLAFLVLLLVSLASLTRVETQVASNSQSIAQARQNALLALNLALGQLQKHAGPDQRVTARADLQPLATTAVPASYPTNDPASNTNLSGSTASALGSIDTYWRASRNRHWTGVWRNSNTPDYSPAPAAAFDADTPAKYNPVAALQSWLVSGNEDTAVFNPAEPVTNFTLAGVLSPSAPTARFGTLATPYRLLVGPGTVNIEKGKPETLDRAVVAPEIEIKAIDIPGTDGNAATVGHYAWWVGDEGVKARANLTDPYAKSDTGESVSEKLARETNRLQSAQRPVIEAMTSSGSDGLAPFAPPVSASALAEFQDSLRKAHSPSQLGYVIPSADLSLEFKSRFHDLSVTSRGVLSDAKRGGLKGDLSYLLGQSSQTNFLTALRAFYGDNAIAPLATTASSLSANPLLTPVSTKYATLPSPSGGGNYTDLFKNTATWEQLWSFANQGATFNTASPAQATPRRQTATQHGLYPIIIQTKLFYRLRIEGGEAIPDDPSDPASPLINRTGTIWIDMIPLVVLANPYAVPLGPGEYQLRMTALYYPRGAFGKPPVDGDENRLSDFSQFGDYHMGEGIVYRLRSSGMAAGEAQIFTIDPASIANPSISISSDKKYARIPLSSPGEKKDVVMRNEFDPVTSLTFNTDTSIPADKTHAALLMQKTHLVLRLYMDYDPAQGERRLIQYTLAQRYTLDAEYGGSDFIFIVDPMTAGIRQGGGINTIINQAPTTDHPAASPGVDSVFFSHQQAPFMQVNYRALLVNYSGSDGTSNHVLEWARRFAKNGSTGSSGDTPNQWIGANLLRPSGSTTNVRWGLVNIGEGQAQTVPPASIGGANALSPSHVAYQQGFNNYLYDIPRPGRPLASLGQLQHLNTAGYIPDTAFKAASTMNSWQINYPISNSYPQPRVPRDRLFNYVNTSSSSLGYHYDGASLWNDLFWDHLYFSSFPQSGSFDFATRHLVNSRYRPFRDRASIPWNDESKFRGDGKPATASNARVAASNLLVDGSFNINSTSVEAWKAVFSSLKNVHVGTESSTSAPFSRTLSPSAGSSSAATAISGNSWSGFRDLSPADIQSLAEETVMQIRKRGPFLSLADFVNRRLIDTASDTFGLGLSGALQAALDSAVNQTSRLAPAFNVKSSVPSANAASAARSVSLAEIGYVLPTAAAGFPGYVLQGDVLSALGSTLSARSDTFTIRTYGDAVNPATGEVTGRAWCEAVVQRTTDYVDSATDAPHADPAAGSVNETFGRRFQITSFRWLSPEDV